MVEALALELLVADREHLVDDEHIGFHMHRNGKSEAHVHAARVVLYRTIDKRREARKIDNPIEDHIGLFAAQPQNRSIEIDVLSAREFRMKPRAQFEQSRDPSGGRNGSGSRKMNAGHHSEEC